MDAAKGLPLGETPFLHTYVVEHIHDFLVKESGYTTAAAKNALLAEGASHLRKFVSDTPQSKGRYPFKKSVIASLEDARQEWWREQHGGVYVACPDIALRSPCEHRIVFEGKLIRGSTEVAARKALAEGVFESAFYRGLPTLLRGRDGEADSYEFACLLAYDASEGAELWNAWKKVSDDVRESTSKELFTRVMIIRAKREEQVRVQ